MTKRRRRTGRNRMRLVIPVRVCTSEEEFFAFKKQQDEALRRLVRAMAKHDEEQDFMRWQAEIRKAECGGLTDPP
ncbi:MAG: hypothetical protein ACK5TM_08655, partial [Methylobacterium sp.]